MSADPRAEGRLDELLAQEATQGLGRAEAAELARLLGAFPDADPDGFALAAAAVHRAVAPPPEPMPARLAEKLELSAVGFTLAARPAPPKAGRARPPYLAWAGWAVAAGLAGVLVVSHRPKQEPTVAQRKRALEAASAAKFLGDKGGAAGVVVWSTEKQEGYLEVRGLPALDPAKEQYQLWIVDPSKKQPVDGGVFDVSPDGTAVVRVRAPIAVKDAKAFAVTKETAGGVVVSDGPMLLVLTPKQG
ncbi:MAG: anti-sigma factor domain-containing protein [Gemmata sp.]